jgi:hypothetical protein
LIKTGLEAGLVADFFDLPNEEETKKDRQLGQPDTLESESEYIRLDQGWNLLMNQERP